MQLWKKSFLLVFTVIQLVLFCGLAGSIISRFHQEMQQQARIFTKNHQDTQGFLRLLSDSKESSHKEQQIQQRLIRQISTRQQFYYSIPVGDEHPFSTLPEDLQLEALPKQLGIIKTKQHYYLAFQASNLAPAYAQDVTSSYREHRRTIFASILFGLFLSGTISLLLYFQMKRLYRPIQNLAHELRTPLTVISGNAELLLRVRLDPSSHFDITNDILTESKSLQETIQRLLIMGDLKDEPISFKPHRFSGLTQMIEKNYPNLSLTVADEHTINGDQTLLLRLLINLLDNATRSNGHVKLKISNRSFTMSNPGTLPPKLINKLNKGRPLSPGEYHGTGQGFSICREIINYHNGSIEIRSDDETVVVTVRW